MTAARLKSVGLGLRSAHMQTVLEDLPKVDWFELHACNFVSSKINQVLLAQLRRHYRLSFHSVSLDLGGSDPMNLEYLNGLKHLVQAFEPDLVSDHLCFTRLEGHHYHDLLPVPYSEAHLEHVADRIDQVQNVLGRKILVENIAQYTSYSNNTMRVGEFLSALARKTGCELLLDLNNAWVNAHNINESVEHLLEDIPLSLVGEIHLGGCSLEDGRYIDTHAHPVNEEVWDLYRKVCEKTPNLPCLIEWDADLPEFSVLLDQLSKAELIREAELCKRRSFYTVDSFWALAHEREC